MNVTAGSRRTWTWPVTLASGDVDDLDAVGILVFDADGTSDQYAAVSAAGADPLIGTVAVTIEFPDDMTGGSYTLRLDVDDAAGDLEAEQFHIYVISAAAQRSP